MRHYDEQTVELIVLDSEKVRKIRAEFFRHAEECQSCRMQYEDIADYYRRLSGPQLLTKSNSSSPQGLQLQPEFGLPTRAKRAADRKAIVQFVVRHRTTMVTLGSISLVSVLAFALAVRSSHAAKSAHHVDFDNARQAALVYSERGAVLFAIPVPTNTPAESWRTLHNAPTTLVKDLDRDGEAEVITIIPDASRESPKQNLLRVFRSDGSTKWTRTIGERVAFRGEDFANDFNTMGLAVGDFDKNGKLEILVGAAHYHSPYLLYRLDDEGTELGQYRTYGHIKLLTVTDLEGDGAPEVILSGQLDYPARAQRPLIVALDPAAISGVTEASFSPGYGVPPSRAERFALRIPLTPMDSATSAARPIVTEVKLNIPAEIRFIVQTDVADRMWHVEYAISRDFVPLQAKWTNSARDALADLTRRSRSASVLARFSPDQLIRSIDFWDGSSWTRDLQGPPKLGGTFTRSPWNAVRGELQGTNFVLFNELGRTLRTVPVSEQEANELREKGHQKFALLDCDGDSLNELIMYRKKVAGSRSQVSLISLSVERLTPLWEKRLRWEIAFPNKSDDVTPEYAAGYMYIEDLDGDGRMEIVAISGNQNLFPYMIYRVDPASGKELNIYLHIGSITSLSFADLNSDGVKEILAGGVNNSFNEADFFVLPGDRFTGVSPHTPEYTPSGWSPGNEIGYLRFPRTAVGDQFWAYAADNVFQSVDLLDNEKKLQVWIKDFGVRTEEKEMQFGAIGITLSYDLRPIQVSTGSLFDAVARRLFKQGKLEQPIDARYWKEYLASIRQWNRSAWYSGAGNAPSRTYEGH